MKIGGGRRGDTQNAISVQGGDPVSLISMPGSGLPRKSFLTHKAHVRVSLHHKAIQMSSCSTEEPGWKEALNYCVCEGRRGNWGWGGGAEFGAGLFLKGGKGSDASAAEISLQRIL